jgi:hypothetical protein
MNNSKKTKCCIITAAITLLVVFIAAPAGAWDLNWNLKGDYAWNATSTCASATYGFTTDPFPLRKPIPGAIGTPPQPAPGISYTYSVQGKFSFDGHGAFHLEGEVLSIILEPYRATPEGDEVNTYKNFKSPVHHLLALDGNGIYTITNEADGLFVEITFSSIKIPGTAIEFNGAIVRGRLDTVMGTSIVFLSTTSPIPEDVIGLSLTPAQRICNATGSMVKLLPRKNWFSKE